MNRWARWLLLVALMIAAPMVNAEDSAALIARMQAAGIQNSLDAPGIKPWHLKVTYQLFDDKGSAGEQGIMEEWWSSPKLYKISFTGPSYSATVIQNQDGQFKSSAAKVPHLLTMLPELMVHPMPQEQILTDATPRLQRQQFGKQKVELDCITLTSFKPEVSLGLFRTYCLDDMNRLRLFYNAGTVEAGFNQLGVFQQRTVGVDFFMAADGKKILAAHLATLQIDPSDAAEFTPSPDMAKLSQPKVLNVEPTAIRGLKISGPAPEYPQSARMRHIEGSVLLSVTIGVDGHVHDMTVTSSPDADLARAAEKAVQQWVYKPYQLNGVPTAVHSVITINFRFGN